ncbi:MAG: hypothetical protein HIU84_03850 [Acidobacteria bacterium]|nr:hypothetical protein [Acidobacteriota bacterium]
MTTMTTLSAGELRGAICTYADLLRSHKDVINRLNVYPVPDGDTGTNMAQTKSASSSISEVTCVDS